MNALGVATTPLPEKNMFVDSMADRFKALTGNSDLRATDQPVLDERPPLINIIKARSNGSPI